jgi:hypothetical protein
MSIIKTKAKGTPSAPFMADFVPLNGLWEGAQAPYPSEHSARWAFRKLRTELASAQAVAMHCGRTLIHPQRFAEVAERAAIAQFADRVHQGWDAAE